MCKISEFRGSLLTIVVALMVFPIVILIVPTLMDELSKSIGELAEEVEGTDEEEVQVVEKEILTEKEKEIARAEKEEEERLKKEQEEIVKKEQEELAKKEEEERIKKEEEDRIKREKEKETREKNREKAKEFFKIATKVIGAIIGIFLLIYGLSKVPYRKIKNKVKESYTDWKLRKKIGYTSYKKVVEVRNYMEQEYSRRKVGTDVDNIIKKLGDIEKVYLANMEGYGVDLYKYEQTFEEMLGTLVRAKGDGVLNDSKLIDVLVEAVSFPYEEIVGDGVVSKVVKSMEKEIEILKDLNKRG